VTVPDIDAAAGMFESLLGYPVIPWPLDDPIQKVTVNFVTQSDAETAEIELITPLNEDSPLRTILNQNGAGLITCVRDKRSRWDLAHL
jgi:methylmalonyl-CoA/ethylmalonyl-CoA epimerase